MAAEEPMADPAAREWWVVSGDVLMAMLRQVADGEDPGVVYTEGYVNSLHEDVL